MPCFGTYNKCLFKTIDFIFIYATITDSFDEISSFYSFCNVCNMFWLSFVFQYYDVLVGTLSDPPILEIGHLSTL